MTDNSQYPGYAFVQSRVSELKIRQLQSGNKKQHVAKDNVSFRVSLVLGSLLPNLQTMFNGDIKVLKKTLELVLIDADVEFFDENGDKVVAEDKQDFVHLYVKNRVNPLAKRMEEEKKAAADLKLKQPPVEEETPMPRLGGHPGSAQYGGSWCPQGYHDCQFPVQSYYFPNLPYQHQHRQHFPLPAPMQTNSQDMMQQQHINPNQYHPNQPIIQNHYHMHPPQQISWSQAQDIAMGSNDIDQGPRQRLQKLEPQVLHDNDMETLGVELLDALSMSNGSVASGNDLSIDSLGLGQQSVSSFAGLLSIDTFVPSEVGSLGEAHHHMEFDLEG